MTEYLIRHRSNPAAAGWLILFSLDRMITSRRYPSGMGMATPRPPLSQSMKLTAGSSAIWSRTRVLALLAGTILLGCAGLDTAPKIPVPQERYVITYYDRNHDGVVDFELRDIPGASDAAWALSDTTFGGRYTVRLKFGFVFERERVDIPVPKQVKITKGKPPVFTTQ